MKPIVLKSIAAPPLRAYIPKKAFSRLFMVAFALCITRSLPIILAGVFLYYLFLLRQTRANPFFMEERQAQKRWRKTQNVHSIRGNYYSA